MDSNIIIGICNGDRDAMYELYSAYFERALRLAIAITRNRDMAQDAVQETFIRVYRNMHTFDQTKRFEPWLYKILVNESRRLLKKEQRLFFWMRNDYKDAEHIQADESPDYEELYEAIQSLSDKVRLPIILKYLQGFSEKEIADTLDIPLNTVKSRLFQGRKKLLKQLQDLEERSAYHA
ncbi:RNA polymerase sigma factor [Hazenella sp. IB182353]|uniref:RNA polymerase sigma factor n=1 Tax=Polycladospora coralii TaxID=2771432 RepID=UPI001BCF148D|nr:RNA polymerase sigma factor [Polycladospora coralii]MBS7530643.1 RNA polymerase sigma factor [Polycladospora coralii]